MCAKSGEFWEPGITSIVLCRKNTYNRTNYDIPIEPHKTRRQSRPPFSIYALGELGVWAEDGLWDHKNNLLIGSEILYK